MLTGQFSKTNMMQNQPAAHTLLVTIGTGDGGQAEDEQVLFKSEKNKLHKIYFVFHNVLETLRSDSKHS